MIDRITKDLVIERGVTVEIKAKAQFAWRSAMEQINHTHIGIYFMYLDEVVESNGLINF